MRDHTNFHVDTAAIRSLLDGTDPVADPPASGTSTRLAGIKDQILLADASSSRKHRWSLLALRRSRRLPLARRRSRMAVAYAVVPALLAVTGAAWVVSSSHQPGMGLVCYAHPTQHTSAGLVGAAGGVTASESPVAYCAHMWAIGAFNHTHHGHVPPLVACETSYGIGVWPWTTCAALGLRPLTAGYLSASRNLVAFTNAIHTQIPDTHRCVREPQAVAIARQLLDRYGYASWHLTIYSRFDLTGATLSPSTSCVGSVVFPEHHLVELVLSPGPDTAYGRFSAAFDRLGPSSCKPGSRPFDTKELFTPRMHRLLALGMPGWTIRVKGHWADRAHPCYGEAEYPRSKRIVLSAGPTIIFG
jgi:hypothetical protein